MTVKALKNKLDKFPDDAKIYIRTISGLILIPSGVLDDSGSVVIDAD